MNKLVVVDVQPEYESNTTFDVGDMLRSAAEDYSSVLFLFNGEDTLGMVSESALKDYYFEKLDYDEEIYSELLSKSEFFDKGYGFFRDAMDSDVCFDRKQIVKIVKYMLDNDLQDIRDLSEEDVEAIGVNELLFDDLEDYGFWVPELSEVLPSWSGSNLVGGARNECMAEVEILGAAQGLTFNHVDDFIYEGEKRYSEDEVLTESALRNYIREILVEATELPKEYFTAIDSAVSASKFWEKPNSQEDIDYYKSAAGGVMATPAIEALSDALEQSMKEVGLDMDVLVRSHDTDDLMGMSLHPDHPAWPDRWLVDAKWYISKERPGRSTIDIEVMTSEDEDDIASALDPNALVRHITQTIRHELVHYHQMKKQAKSKGLDDSGAFEEMLNDPKQIPKGDPSDPEWQKKYLRSHIEIDAHAHDGAEELVAVYDEDQINSILRGKIDLSDRKLPNAIRHYVEVLGQNDKATQKFMSKLYTQVQSMKNR